MSDDWIACSERMPAEGKIVIVYIPQPYSSNWHMLLTSRHGGRWWNGPAEWENPPTHWTLPPEPPTPAAVQATTGDGEKEGA